MTTKAKKQLDPVSSAHLNMGTRYKWKGGNNLFTQGKTTYGPNEIAVLACDPIEHDDELNPHIRSAQFISRGARVRVVRWDDAGYHVYPIDAPKDFQVWCARMWLDETSKGVDRELSDRRYMMKGVRVSEAQLSKLEPADAFDDLYHRTQKKMAMAGVKTADSEIHRVNFETLMRDVFLVLGRVADAQAFDLRTALSSAVSRDYYDHIMDRSGDRTARQAAHRASKADAKLLGQPLSEWARSKETVSYLEAHLPEKWNPLNRLYHMPADDVTTVLAARLGYRNVQVVEGIPQDDSAFVQPVMWSRISRMVLGANYYGELKAALAPLMVEAKKRKPDVTEAEVCAVLGIHMEPIHDDVDLTPQYKVHGGILDDHNAEADRQQLIRIGHMPS